MPVVLWVTNNSTLGAKKVTMRSNWKAGLGGREKDGADAGGDFIDACVCRLSCCFILASTDDLCVLKI